MLKSRVNKSVKRLLRRTLWDLLDRRYTSYSEVVDNLYAFAKSTPAAAKQPYLEVFGTKVQECLAYGWHFGVLGEELPRGVTIKGDRAERLVWRETIALGYRIGAEVRRRHREENLAC